MNGVYTKLDNEGMKTLKEHLMEYVPNSALFPFYGTLLLYFLLYQPIIGDPTASVGAALFKVLPVWSLAYFVLSTEKRNIDALMNHDYKKFIFLGLLVSSVGDALLVARITLFIPGLLVFAIAHVSYILAFDPPTGSSKLQNLYILCGIATFLTLQESIDSFIMSSLVLLYLVLIYVMSWRATNAYEKSQTFPTYAACVGSILFVISDSIIAVDKWKFAVPFAQFLVMISYYSAQFFLALSTDFN